jgi:hypothetical protein
MEEGTDGARSLFKEPPLWAVFKNTTLWAVFKNTTLWADLYGIVTYNEKCNLYNII